MLTSALTQLLKLKTKKKLVILTYHRVLRNADPIFKDDVDKDLFDQQMSMLSKYFNVLKLSDAANRLKNDNSGALANIIMQ